MYKTWIVFTMMMLVMTGCSNEKTERVELTISAAVSLKNSLDELKIIFQNENPDLKLHLNYGSSGSLYKQIVQGAPVDVFISADSDHVRELVNNNLVNDGEYIKLLVNALVLIAKRSDISSFSDLSSSEVTSVAIGHPETVPAGKYAKASLSEQQMWGKIESKVVFAKDVRQVLTYVETGQIDTGVVYKTDAILSDKVRIVEVFDPTSHPPIVYPAAVMAGSSHKKEASAFLKFLQEKRAQDVFAKYGFIQAPQD